MNINIEKFAEAYNQEYEFLYSSHISGYDVAGEQEAAEEFDERMKNPSFKSFVAEYAKYRQDYISSDTEAAAFMFALSRFE